MKQPTPPDASPQASRKKRGIISNLQVFCGIIGLAGILVGTVLYRNVTATRDLNRAVERLRESLAKDAEGGNRLHAWATRLGELEEGVFTWVYDKEAKAFRRNFDDYWIKTEEDQERLERAELPLPLPSALEELLSWGNESTLRVWRRTPAEINRWGPQAKTQVTLMHHTRFADIHFSMDAEYLNSAPPPAAVFRNTSSRGGEYGEYVFFSPGIHIWYDLSYRYRFP